MKYLYTFVLLALLPAATLAQHEMQKPGKTAITGDFLGNTMAGVNVHRRMGAITDYKGRQTGFFDGSLGIGYFTDRLFTLPHGLTANLGRKNDFLEFGYVGTYYFRFNEPPAAAPIIKDPLIPLCGCLGSGPKKGTYAPSLLVGYRRQAPSGFVLRLNGAVVLSDERYILWRVMPGISLGWAF